MKTKRMTTTFVTGFFNLLPTWHPSFESKYEEYKKASADLLKQDIYLIFFGDETMASHVLSERKAHGLALKTFLVPMNFANLPLYKHMEKMQEIYTYEDVSSQFVLNSRFTPRYLITILSKLFLVEKAQQYNPFDSIYFLWMDYGYYRHRETQSFSYSILKPNVFANIESSMKGDLFRIGATSPPTGNECNPALYYKKYNQAVAGCLFGGSALAIRTVASKYKEEIEWLLENNINTCEENIFGRLIALHPSLFDIFVTKYTTALNNFAWQTCSVEYCILQVCKFCFFGNNHAELSNCLRILDAVKNGHFNIENADMLHVFNYICISSYYIDRKLYNKYKEEALAFISKHKLALSEKVRKNLSY